MKSSYKEFWIFSLFSIALILSIIWACEKEDPELPLLITAQVSEITSEGAVSGGNILDDGGSPVTGFGVVWSTSENPNLDSNEGYTRDGEGSGEFTSKLTGLDPGTKYYVRAYATNSVGTAYGEEVDFTTSGKLPIVTTADVTDVNSTSAVSGGNVKDDGGEEVTARGVVWSITGDPSLEENDGITEDGEGVGKFTSQLKGLDRLTTYYVRAYAINSVGKSYGEQRDFTTYVNLATVTTSHVKNITTTTAVSGGNVKDDGGMDVTARGIVWSSVENPKLEENEGFTEDGEGVGEFESKLTGLDPGTTYYVRSYATNSAGIGYGYETGFTTNTKPTYSLSLSAEPETGGKVDGEGNYEEGEEVELVATAGEGYEFVNWTDPQDSQVSDNATFTYTMPGEDIALTANFDLAEYNLTLSASPSEGGGVTGDGTYNYGDEVEITASPADGYYFDGWTGDTGHIDDAGSESATVTMPSGDISLTANFDLAD